MKNNCIGQEDILFFGKPCKDDREAFTKWISLLAVMVIWGAILLGSVMILAGEV